ncbi:S-antigen protein-like [Gadus macrocephalus]|uniref:S-antigen protein-like n=1 Tax=Gadus macrocephalus TaxID=80720 RepID=UPI0028CB2619|nr:S-antigen protein-like [Gadus macrocephalus]
MDPQNQLPARGGGPDYRRYTVAEGPDPVPIGATVIRRAKRPAGGGCPGRLSPEGSGGPGAGGPRGEHPKDGPLQSGPSLGPDPEATHLLWP